MNSKNYDDIGLVASKLENDWERPKKLDDKSVSRIFRDWFQHIHLKIIISVSRRNALLRY